MIRINHFHYSLVIVLAIIIYSFSIVQGNSLEQAVLETDLNSDGSAYEINVGVDGVIWVSDNLAGEIRGYHPNGKSVGVFSGLGSVSDARAAADGMVWFVDQDLNQLVRLDPLSATSISWEIPGEGSVFGTNVDALGNIWVTKFNDSTIFRLTPGNIGNSTRCEIDLTTSGYSGSDYIVDQSGNLWLGGVTNEIIYVQPGISDVDVTTFTVSKPDTWVFEVEGLFVDGLEGLWFADASPGRSLVHLVPEPEPVFFRFSLPTGGGTPYMIARSNGQIWYSGYDTSVIGKLDSTLVSPTIYEGTSNYLENVTMTCNPVTGIEKNVASESFTPLWTSITYPITELSGWMITNLGSDSYPWGIASKDDVVWSVDQGRQVLIRFGEEFTNDSYIFLPLVIK